jgi:hypothetical protein
MNAFLRHTILKSNSAMKTKALLGIMAAAMVAATTAVAQSVNTVTTNNLFGPSGVALIGTAYYITDSFNNRILRYEPSTAAFLQVAGDIDGLAGTNNGSGTLASFNNPYGIVAARGGVIVADQFNHTIRFVSPDGTTVTNIAGIPSVPGFVNGAAATAQFRFPTALAVDPLGNIYVADSFNNAIRKIDTNNVVTTYAVGFYQPAGVAVGDNGDIWVADTRNHLIKSVDTNGVITVRAGTGSQGYLVAPTALGAKLSNPRGILWMGAAAGLLVADSGNNVVRRLYTNTLGGGYKLETSAGVPGQAGLVDGATNVAKFNNPNGVTADPINGAFLVVDSANSALRRIQLSTPQPPISDPTIGYVVPDEVTGRTKLIKVIEGVFNNDVLIAIRPEGLGVETFYSVGVTPTNAFLDTVPTPTRATGTSPFYEDGSSVFPDVFIISQPDLTIKALSTQDGRQPSSEVKARFQFKTATPIVVGNNAASFTVTAGTTNATIYYTLDGSDPTNGPPSLGPIASGDPLSITLNNSNVTFKAMAFRTSYQPSGIASTIFTPTNFVANQITWGFAGGEASSDFVGAAGQTFIAPVTLTLLPGQSMYTLQFAITVTNLGSAPAVAPAAFGFESMLVETRNGTNIVISNNVYTGTSAFASAVLTSDGTDVNDSETVSVGNITYRFKDTMTATFDVQRSGTAATTLSNLRAAINNSGTPGVEYFTPVANSLVTAGPVTGVPSLTVTSTLDGNTGNFIAVSETSPHLSWDSTNLSGGVSFVLTNLLHTNALNNLLSVGWITRRDQTELYDSRAHDLISQSQPHDNVFLGVNGKVVVGAYRFSIPSSAVSGNLYRIRLGRPSATADGIAADAFIQAPTNGALQGSSPVNATKDVQVGNRVYIVGDVAPFRWFNAGDFGDTNIIANDAAQVFEAAVHGFAIPPQASDLYDAMDASDGTVANVAAPNATIDAIDFGDGVLAVDDVYVTYRRALDPNLLWWARYWSNGVLNAVVVPNVFRGRPDLGQGNRPATQLVQASTPATTLSTTTTPRRVTFVAGDAVASAGQTLQVPITAQISGDLPIRVLLLDLVVTPLDGSPALTDAVTFAPVPQLGAAAYVATNGPGGYAAAWLNEGIAGISGTSTIGTLTIKLPAGATADAAYSVQFRNVSGSPNGLSLFPQRLKNGLITLRDRSGSTPGDGISDQWRLRFFGSVSNLLAAANADADGDGIPNWAEYRAGTSPADAGSGLRLVRPSNDASGAITLRWPTAESKSYIVEGSDTLGGTNWTAISGIIAGTGDEVTFQVPTGSGAIFYRIRLVD